ncbi:hypothetical protein MOE57_14535 [Bacillus inaquosorum]|nr:hypothetical protein [Bacillus inaquosorum]MCY9083685.1 hypothetical protein [Bacillus inaquosorum]
MVYDGLAAIIGTKVVEVSDHLIVFDNGIRIECEDIECYLNVSQYKEAE